MQWKWRAQATTKTYYAVRSFWVHRKLYSVAMHVVVFGNYCDHKNRNGLDNRRENLRKAALWQQNCNRGLPRNNTSGYKGVYASRCRYSPWQARIGYKGKSISLGYYETKLLAAKAYDKAALEYHGEFAVLNFPKS